MWLSPGLPSCKGGWYRVQDACVPEPLCSSSVLHQQGRALSTHTSSSLLSHYQLYTTSTFTHWAHTPASVYILHEMMRPYWHCKLRVEAGLALHPKPIYKLNKTTGSLEPCGFHAFPEWTQTHQVSRPPHSPWLQCTSAMNRMLLRSTPKGTQEEIWVAQTGNTFMGTLQPSLPPLPSLP